MYNSFSNLSQDRSGDTNLIHAAKAGHKSIVEALLKKYADVDMTGKVKLIKITKCDKYFIWFFSAITIHWQERKTALYWAVEKSHISVVRSLLTSDPNLEISTKVSLTRDLIQLQENATSHNYVN